ECQASGRGPAVGSHRLARPRCSCRHCWSWFAVWRKGAPGGRAGGGQSPPLPSQRRRVDREDFAMAELSRDDVTEVLGRVGDAIAAESVAAGIGKGGGGAAPGRGGGGPKAPTPRPPRQPGTFA